MGLPYANKFMFFSQVAKYIFSMNGGVAMIQLLMYLVWCIWMPYIFIYLEFLILTL
jgi:hypothetical protein